MKQEMTGWQRHQLDHMQIICTLLQTDNHISTSSLNFFTGKIRIASAVLATAIPSVRLSVCLSHAGIVSRRLHVALCSLHCQIAKCV